MLWAIMSPGVWVTAEVLPRLWHKRIYMMEWLLNNYYMCKNYIHAYIHAPAAKT